MNRQYDPDSIGPVLARLRRARGYTQLHLAQSLCARSGYHTITRCEVSRWEREERIPSEFWLRWLAEALEISLGVLRRAANTTRIRRRPERLQDSPATPVVESWLTLHRGPDEVMIALTGVQVDQLRTVLAPATTDPEPAGPETTTQAMEAHR